MSGDKFRRLREKLGLSQMELSTIIDVSERGIRRWENEEVPIPKIAELAMRFLIQNPKHRGQRRWHANQV